MTAPALVSLGDIAEFINGDRGKNYPSKAGFVPSGIPFINAGHLINGEVDFAEMNYISEGQFQKLGSGKTQQDDILYCLRGSLGKTAVVRHAADAAIASSLVIIRPSKATCVRYVYRYLTSPLAESELRQFDNGSSQPNLSATSVKKYQIPLPPLAEQERIAGILDAADALRAKRREALAQLDTLLQATFLDHFGDPVTNAKGWEVRTLEASGAKTKVGPFGSLLHTYDYIAGGVPLVNPKHMVDGRIVHGGDETVSEEKAAELQDYRLKVGDLLVARRGEMGRCVIVQQEHTSWLCGTGSFYVRPRANVMLTEFLAACISSEPMRKFLEHVSGGAIMPSLSGTQIKNLSIPLPPLEAQTRFVRASHAIVEQQRQQSKHLAELDTLFASLQSRAFRGEL